MAHPIPISAEQMRPLLDVSRTLAGTLDLDVLLVRIAEAATSLLDCDRASIFLHDPEKDQLWTKVALQAAEIRIPCSAGIAGHVFKTNQLLHVPSPYEDTRFNPDVDRRTGYVTRNLLTAPMIDLNHMPVGVIQAVNKNSGSFTDNDKALMQLLADQGGVAVQRHRLVVEAMQNTVIRREMELAKRVQERLIPACAPEMEGLEAVGWSKPASTTGGDCFDLWKLRDGRLGIFLADASGHGLAPAMIVSQARTLVRALSEIETRPHKLLSLVNDRLCQDLDPERFVTAFLGFMASDGTLHWSSAGHGPVFARNTVRRELETLQVPALPLGVIEEWLDEPGPDPVQLEPGGALIAISDGIFEEHDDTGEQFGIGRVMLALDATRDKSPAVMLGALRKAAQAWQPKDDPTDDQTIVVVRRRPVGVDEGLASVMIDG